MKAATVPSAFGGNLGDESVPLLPQAPLGTAAAVVEAYGERLDRLSPPERALVKGRVVQRQGWRRVARRAGMSAPAAMRGLRRAVRRLLDA